MLARLASSSQCDLALAANTFSVSEFLEAAIRCALVVAPPVENDPSTGAPPTVAARARQALIAFLDDYLVPLATRVGIERFRQTMTSLPALVSKAAQLAPVQAKLFVLYGKSNRRPGVGLHKFLALSELFHPDLPRARVKAVFIQCVPLGAIGGAHAAAPVAAHAKAHLAAGGADGSGRTLDASLLWEALVRLALLSIDVHGTFDHSNAIMRSSPEGGRVGAELACSLEQLTEAQLRTVGATVEAVLERTVGTKAERALEQRAASKVIQALLRGKAARLAIGAFTGMHQRRAATSMDTQSLPDITA